ARVGITLQVLDHIGDLIDVCAAGHRPGTPLPPVDRPKLAVLVGPFVPDGYAVLVEITNIRRSLQEPEQLVDDRLDVQILGSDERKAVFEVEAHLRAEQTQRARAGAVPFAEPIMANPGEKIEILPQGELLSSESCPYDLAFPGPAGKTPRASYS